MENWANQPPASPRFLRLPPKRNHGAPGQRAMIAAKARDYYDPQAKERPVSHLKHEAERPVMGNSPQRENVQEKGAARDQTGLALSSFLTALDC
jgi:hypothetical protein